MNKAISTDDGQNFISIEKGTAYTLYFQSSNTVLKYDHIIEQALVLSSLKMALALSSSMVE